MKNLIVLFLMAFAFTSCQKENPQPVLDLSGGNPSTQTSFRVASGFGYQCDITSLEVRLQNGGAILQSGEGCCINETYLFGELATVEKDSIYIIQLQENYPTPPLTGKHTEFEFKIDYATGDFVILNYLQGGPATIEYLQDKNMYLVHIQ